MSNQLNKIVKIPLISIERRVGADKGYIDGLLKLGKIENDYLEIMQWDLYLYNKRSNENHDLNKGARLIKGVSKWAKSGFLKTPEDILNKRLSICQACEFWNPEGFRGTGKCTKCGCSTWAKLRMATERCPIGKWEAHLTSPPN